MLHSITAVMEQNFTRKHKYNFILGPELWVVGAWGSTGPCCPQVWATFTDYQTFSGDDPPTNWGQPRDQWPKEAAGCQEELLWIWAKSRTLRQDTEEHPCWWWGHDKVHYLIIYFDNSLRRLCHLNFVPFTMAVTKIINSEKF